MSEIGAMNLVLMALVLLVLAIFIYIIVKIKNEGDTDKTQESQLEKNLASKLDELLLIVSNKQSSKDTLEGVAIDFVQNFPFPAKRGENIPKHAKGYLNFILLLARHKNTDAKLIAFVNKELKKRNPTYSNEIDIYEDQGIKQRRSNY